MIECARLSLMALWLAAICEIPERKNKNEKIKFINAFIALISLSKKRKIKIFTTFPYCRFMYVYNDVCVCVFAGATLKCIFVGANSGASSISGQLQLELAPELASTENSCDRITDLACTHF